MKEGLNDKEKRALIVLVAFASILVVTGFITSIFDGRKNTTTTSRTLPPHVVSETSLGNGKRVQVNSTNPDLTPDECINLARAYSRNAGTGGQVVVEKIYTQAPWNGEPLAFCYDNQDGKGVQFNEW